jgi:hypothetical protein
VSQPKLALPRRALNFGHVSPGSRTIRAFTLRNDGGGTLTGHVDASPPFSVGPASSFALGPGQACEVRVCLHAGDDAPVTGVVTVTSNAGQARISVSAGISFGDVVLASDQTFCFAYHCRDEHPPVRRDVKPALRPGATVEVTGTLVRVVPGTTNPRLRQHPAAVFVSRDDWRTVRRGTPMRKDGVFLIRWAEPNVALSRLKWRCSFPANKLDELKARWENFWGSR